jgi:hypothetical protein
VAGANAKKLLETGRIEIELGLKRMIPDTVTVSEGSYEIRLINSTYVKNMTITLDRSDNGQRVGQRDIDSKAVKIRPVFDLKPGTHVLSVVGRPDLRAVILVNRKP